MLSDGDKVKFAIMSASQYAELEEKDDATVYFITSDFEQRVAVGNSLFANYVPAHCTSLSLSVSSEIIGVDESFYIIATTEPANPSDLLTFSASNNNVTITQTASSNRIMVTGAAVGSSVITATCGEYTATCQITIHPELIYVEHILAENYQPNGAKFKFTAPISLTNGEYIEVSIDVSGITGNKENILSIGQNIDVWQGANTGSRMHMYDTYTAKQTVSVDLIKNTLSRRPTYNAPTTTIVVKVDRRGVSIDGELFDFNNQLRQTATLDYETGIAGLVALTSFDIGSQEGSNRSHATYNYIKYYTVEEA